MIHRVVYTQKILSTFKNYNVRKVAALINGESLPGQPIKTDFQNDIYIEGYRSLFAASGKLNRDEAIDITREDYKGGYSLFGCLLYTSPSPRDS